MTDPLGTVATAIGVFAGTNIDDLIVLTVLFLAARATGRPRPWQIWVGQATGIALLVTASAAMALGLAAIPDEWVGLLGLVPLGLGIWGFVQVFRGGDEAEPPVVAAGALAVAGLTVANGADNIAVYAPVFRTLGLTGTLLTIGVFALLVAVWCAAGSWLGSHRAVVAVMRRHGHWLVPAVFVAIGVVIILESGVLARLL
ncbi:cadmium resistance protein CadD (predicted permease) [Allocatelliglobosispora scoriae]|uniref:Cadmium resistance protein CadD (Predicted permease) n=1 Tax=Allocatelliglobosispora scoriae TaxID=643052 RepID=A0A841C487_9ACTN|nr:cadmium resistance transporter [Allocatelliglobosispora scoriae]MBB5873872.1 cadmium resistance protein CadD (predicted permease) [Allocatelliglobosispora scoriae]